MEYCGYRHTNFGKSLFFRCLNALEVAVHVIATVIRIDGALFGALQKFVLRGSTPIPGARSPLVPEVGRKRLGKRRGKLSVQVSPFDQHSKLALVYDSLILPLSFNPQASERFEDSL